VIVSEYKRARKLLLVLDSAYHVLSLQLFDYLVALKEQGLRLEGGPITPAAAAFAPLLGGFRSVDHPDEADADSFNPFGSFNPRGVIDFDWAQSIEPASDTTAPRTYAVRVRKDGQISDVDKSDALTGPAFHAMLAHMRGRIGELIDRWLDGDIAVRPAYHRDRLPCSTCPFADVCRFEAGRDPVNRLDTLGRLEVVNRLNETAT
ncbi:MAG: PD-(D/E)XK nuclease family protein, partial [Phycisphaerae bacterium]